MFLTKLQLEKYADVLIWGLSTARTKKFSSYEAVLLRFDLDALPLAEILYRKLIAKRMNVSFRLMTPPSMELGFYSASDSTQRKFVFGGEKEFYSSLSGSIFINAPGSLTHLKNIPPGRISELLVARKPLRKILDDREAKGLFGWTLCTMPTAALAEKAGLSQLEYSAQIVKACFLDEKDPVCKWKEIFRDTDDIKRWLTSLPARRIRIESAGTDLSISLGERRRYLGVSGHNIPSFEIFVSPDWRGTEGVYFADQPSYRSGNIVRDVKLVFQKGRAVSVTAREGAAFAKKMLAMDGNSMKIGEFSLTDRRFSKIDRFMADTLFDENFGGLYGNCHIALGNSYTDTFSGDPATLTTRSKKALGFNDSALHWDLINIEDKKVTVTLKDGRLVTIYENGMFKR